MGLDAAYRKLTGAGGRLFADPQPAPAQGAIMVVCRENDEHSFSSCHLLNHDETALCTKIERDFLSGLMGGCSTPISALAEVKNGKVIFRGEIANPDAPEDVVAMTGNYSMKDASRLGFDLAEKMISQNQAKAIIDRIRIKGLNANGKA